MSWQDRYWSRVNKTGICWEWRGTLDKDGYGVITVLGKKRKAHRIALEIMGIDVSDKVVRHSCDNPKCVNPSHLSVGSQAQNNEDARARKRYKVKLDDTQVLTIRTLYGSGKYTLLELAKEYNVSFQHVSAIFHKIKRSKV